MRGNARHFMGGCALLSTCALNSFLVMPDGTCVEMRVIRPPAAGRASSEGRASFETGLCLSALPRDRDSKAAMTFHRWRCATFHVRSLRLHCHAGRSAGGEERDPVFFKRMHGSLFLPRYPHSRSGCARAFPPTFFCLESIPFRYFSSQTSLHSSPSIPD